MDDNPEVLIAGAGPVGLALALELQRFGIRFRILEKKPERSKTSKAMGLQPRLSEVFCVLGVAEAFFERGLSNIAALNVRSGDRKPLTIPVRPPSNQSGRDACQPRMIIIPQSITEEILETALIERGHSVERRREVIAFEQKGDRVEATVRAEDVAEEAISARFLVSCEGAHSIIRKQSGFSFSGSAMPLRFLLADVTIDWDAPDNEVQIFFHRDGALAALPFGAKKFRLIIECAEDGAKSPAEVTLPLIQELMAQRTGLKSIAVREPLWLSDFRINARMVDRFRDRRVFVAGDAAHIHSPLGGQGIATGIQDASNLAWKLAAVLRDGAPDSLLDTFEEERRPIAREVLRRTSMMSHVVFGIDPIMRFLRERVVFPILRTALAQKRMIGRMSQLEMNYRRQSLSVNSGRLPSAVRVQAGDRAPDVLFQQGSEKVSLFSLLGKAGLLALMGPGPHSHALAARLTELRLRSFIVSPQSANTRPDRYLEDFYSDFARLFGARGPFLYIIRPDGHVGLFQARAEPGALADYLKKIRAPEVVEKAFA